MAFRLTSPKIQLSENDVERAVMDLLRWHHRYPVRLQSGKFLHADRAVIEACRRVRVPVRWATIGEPGLPDYCIPELFIETKRPGGKLSPEQEAKIIELRDHWGLETLVIADVDELARWLEKWHEKQH